MGKLFLLRALMFAHIACIYGCNSCRQSTKNEVMIIGQCEDTLSARIHRPVALRMTSVFQVGGGKRLIATVQVAVDSSERLGHMQQLAVEAIKECYPGHVDDTLLEPVSLRVSPGDR